MNGNQQVAFVGAVGGAISAWRELRREQRLLRFVAYDAPIGYALATGFVLVLDAIFDGSDTTQSVGFWETFWRLLAYVLGALSLSWVLRLHRMDSLITSWLKMFVWLAAISWGVMLIHESARTYYYDYTGLGGHFESRDTILSVLAILVYGLLKIHPVVKPFRRSVAVGRFDIPGVSKWQAASVRLEECLAEAITAAQKPFQGLVDVAYTRDDMELVYLRTNSATALAIDDNDGLAIGVSRGLLKLTATEPKIVAAILAHEIGHIIQKDAAHAYQYRVMQRAIVHRVIPFVSLGIFDAIIFPRAYPIIWFSAATVVILMARSTARRAAFLSEYAADLYSALGVGLEPTMSAIKRFGGGGKFHPTIDERVQFISTVASLQGDAPNQSSIAVVEQKPARFAWPRILKRHFNWRGALISYIIGMAGLFAPAVLLPSEAARKIALPLTMAAFFVGIVFTAYACAYGIWSFAQDLERDEDD